MTQVKFKKVETFVEGGTAGNTMEKSLQFGSWKVEREGAYVNMGEGDFSSVFVAWAGDWILTRNGDFYGSFSKLKEVKCYIQYWLSFHPNDL